MYLILIFITIILLILIFSRQNYENFLIYKPTLKSGCETCMGKNRYSCASCSNCGYGIKSNGVGQCAPGDMNGPYDNTKFSYWIYDDPILNYPYSHMFPAVSQTNMEPTLDVKRMYPDQPFYPNICKN